MKTSNILLIVGLAILLAGAIMSYLKIEPWADYVLLSGALVILIRGAFRSREKE
jgi:membrane protein implicated in regulation of membrane protease activity